MVVGALHALGAWLSVRLSGASWDIKAVAMDTDIGTNELSWYRQQQLYNAGVDIQFLNLSNVTHVSRLLSPSPAYVVYIPSVLEREATPSGSAYWGSHMSQFVSLLEGVKVWAPCTRLVMTSLSMQTESHDNHMTIQQAHMTAYEAVLLSYHNLHSLQFTILRTGPAYGPWTQHALALLTTAREGVEGEKASLQSSWYINDVSKAVLLALQKGAVCDVLDLSQCPGLHHYSACEVLNLSSLLPVDQGVKRTLTWARAYVRQQEESGESDVILTSYFTSQQDFQRHRQIAPNRLRYILDWLVSVRDLGLRVVVFHDRLDPGFCHRVMQYHPGVSFRRVPSLAGRTTNDARFYAYRDYLLARPDVRRVLLSDISDVRFQRNPFDLMRLLGDWLYIGTDIDIFPSMQTQRWITERLVGCFGNHTLLQGPLKPLMSLDTVYNAGVIGGQRHLMLPMLERVVGYLDTTPPSLNCNMPAVNYVIHRYFFRQVFTGFPLSSRFLRFQTAPRGVYIVHK